jgi:ribosome-binding factor A
MTKNKSQKQLQIAEQVKRNIAGILAEDNNLSLPGIYLTVTKADVSPDIKNAKIFVNVFGNTDKEKLFVRLNGLAPYFRSQLSKKLTTRHTPELVFILDDSGDEATKIGKLIIEEKKKF